MPYGRLWFTSLVTLLSASYISAQQANQPRDLSPHTIQFVTADNDVKLEVLDWGGSGRPLVFLAGLGNTAHVFDDFAPKFTSSFHVYGVTRRGYGSSTGPAPADGNYSADRLGDDVLAVLDSLKLNRPILVGHSIAGEELSSIGSRHPDRVAGLIYLDGAYGYAHYDPSVGDVNIDLFDLEKKLHAMEPGSTTTLDGVKPVIQELLQQSLPGFEKDLRSLQQQFEMLQASQAPPPTDADRASFSAYQAWEKRVDDFALPVGELMQQHEVRPDGGVGKLRNLSAPGLAIIAGEQKYSSIPVPVLVFYAVPHGAGPFAFKDPVQREAAENREATDMEPLIKAFEHGVPTAKIVRLPRVNHYIFLADPADVTREINAFLSTVPR
jgi:non-heme chloroperoxidase